MFAAEISAEWVAGSVEWVAGSGIKLGIFPIFGAAQGAHAKNWKNDLKISAGGGRQNWCENRPPKNARLGSQMARKNMISTETSG